MSNACCPQCGAPLNRSTQPALIAGRPDTVLLRCSRYACDFTTDERDLHAAVGTQDGYARAQALVQARLQRYVSAEVGR